MLKRRQAINAYEAYAPDLPLRVCTSTRRAKSAMSRPRLRGEVEARGVRELKRWNVYETSENEVKRKTAPTRRDRRRRQDAIGEL
jgi:hypothetical protein